MTADRDVVELRPRPQQLEVQVIAGRVATTREQRRRQLVNATLHQLAVDLVGARRQLTGLRYWKRDRSYAAAAYHEETTAVLADAAARLDELGEP